MRARQRGITLMGLIVGLFILVVLALFAMKVIPSYIEYATAKSAIDAIAREKPGATPAEVRNAFEARAAVDDIRVLRGTDLEIIREGGQTVIEFAYRKEVPLFTNVGLYIDYAASTRQ
ncbi:MAG TPA: DUF4845 domain-containing protein [Burkholderiales bacterium]|nr:DUF4845 domain-containing protein [Burkholderiales bacterium]